MKIIMHNDDKLTEKEINDKIIRARGVIINSNNELLLGYCKGTYQFPGGYLEKGETILEGLKIEIKEETEIVLCGEYKQFNQIKYYSKDWPEKGINRYTEFNYFLIITDEKYNLDNNNLDEYEKENNYELRYVKLDELENALEDSINLNSKNKKVYPEILDVIKTYYEEYKYN